MSLVNTTTTVISYCPTLARPSLLCVPTTLSVRPIVPCTYCSPGYLRSRPRTAEIGGTEEERGKDDGGVLCQVLPNNTRQQTYQVPARSHLRPCYLRRASTCQYTNPNPNPTPSLTISLSSHYPNSPIHNIPCHQSLTMTLPRLLRRRQVLSQLPQQQTLSTSPSNPHETPP